MKNFITKFINDESGQDLVEYTLLLSVVAVAAVVTLGTLNTALTASFVTINAKVNPS